MFRHFPVGLAVIMALHGAPLWANAVDLALPQNAELALELRAPMATRSLALGPFKDGDFDKKTITAPVHDSAFRVALAADVTTASLIAPLRAQLSTAGFTVIYDCETRVCGGFDFRYGLDLLPEPEMHVDLGDFRYLLAQKGEDVISLMVSRSTNYGFIQMTRMGDWAKPEPKVTESTKTPSSPIATALSAGETAVIDGVVFASGQAVLANSAEVALRELADWLLANPTQRMTITGHTDSSGQAAANLALSLARAETLRDILVTQYQIATDRISAIGAGDTRPLAPNDTAESRAKNRRVEVRATP
jgi:OOP family OmpA-OmpF porin